MPRGALSSGRSFRDALPSALVPVYAVHGPCSVVYHVSDNNEAASCRKTTYVHTSGKTTEPRNGQVGRRFGLRH